MANVPASGDRGIFDVSTFKSHISEFGTLPTSRFYMDISLPKVLLNCEQMMNDFQAENININELLRFRAEAVRGAPGVEILLSNINRYGIGPVQQLPYNVRFNNITITFLADKFSIVWSFFYSWLNGLFSYGHDNYPEADSARYRVGYMDDYAVPAQLNVYDVDGKPSASIEFIDFYPIKMDDIALSWSDTNQAKRINVQFAFRHWRMPYVEMCDNHSSVTRPPSLVIPRRQTTIQSARPEKPVREVPMGRLDKEIPRGPNNDPMQNHMNKEGKFNNPTVPGGTDTPTFHMGA